MLVSTAAALVVLSAFVLASRNAVDDTLADMSSNNSAIWLSVNICNLSVTIPLGMYEDTAKCFSFRVATSSQTYRMPGQGNHA